jgi:UDP-N-acetylglucosamine 3-dehydrogenase
MPTDLERPNRASTAPGIHDLPASIAFLGCGAITRTHSRTIAELDQSIGRFYASRDRGRATKYCREFAGRGAFGSYEEALSSAEVGTVLVATPPPTHLALTLNALEQGKHVIVEKPAFLTAADAGLVELRMAAAGRQVLVAENYCYRPLTAFLRDVVASGDLGDILFVHVNATKRQRSPGWRANDSTAGGGALFEGGIHWIHLMASLGLEIDSVSGYEARPGRPIERSSLVVFRYRNGAVGTLQHSWETPTLLRGLRLSKIAGTRGAITFESNGLGAIVTGRAIRIRLPGLADLRGYRAMFRDFIASLATGPPARMTLAMARRDLELFEAARRGTG